MGTAAIFVALFVTALAVVLIRRRTHRRRKHRNHAPELAFLVTEYGFAEPVSHFFSRETHYVFARGNDQVDIFWDATMMGINLRMRGRTTTVSHLSLEELADAIRAHPELLTGDFRALEEAERTTPA